MLLHHGIRNGEGLGIHYDFPYATGVEGYAGLVVHGPLQATLMLNRVATHLGRMPKRFAYRGQSPLISGPSFHVEAITDAEAKMNARVVSSEGIITMVAQAKP
jgi:3-methylfumaryl-CoA hydratase